VAARRRGQSRRLGCGRNETVKKGGLCPTYGRKAKSALKNSRPSQKKPIKHWDVQLGVRVSARTQPYAPRADPITASKRFKAA